MRERTKEKECDAKKPDYEHVNLFPIASKKRRSGVDLLQIGVDNDHFRGFL